MSKSLSVIALIIGFAAISNAETCLSGRDAFAKSVYLKVRKNCVFCHDGRRPDTPMFASPDLQVSYDRLLNYMNFSKIEDSLLVIRAGNGHCKDENCEEEHGQEMKKLAEDWWAGGENLCYRNGRFFSAEVAIPANLPNDKQGFKTLSFDLGSINNQLKEIYLQIDIQDHIQPAENLAYKAYRFKSPRIVSKNSASLKIKNLKVLLNGKYDPVYNAYASIDAEVKLWPVVNNEFKWASTVLSGVHLTLMKDSLTDAKLSVSFDMIEKTNASNKGCANIGAYKTYFKPMVQQLKCSECHNSQAKEYGTALLNFDGAEDNQCAVASTLVEGRAFTAMPLLKIPVQNYGKHPQLDEQSRAAYVQAMKSWLMQ